MKILGLIHSLYPENRKCIWMSAVMQMNKALKSGLAGIKSKVELGMCGLSIVAGTEKRFMPIKNPGFSTGVFRFNLFY